MRVSKLEINNFRIFENNTTINLGKYLTCISGYNGVGKSTLLAILSNIGELKKEKGCHINGDAFQGEFSKLIKGDRNFDQTGKVCTIYFEDLPTENHLKDSYFSSLDFRATFQSAERVSTSKKAIKYKVANPETQKAYLETKTKISIPNKRFRLIPMKTAERQTESKLEWPTYHLGLSRLFPVGESDSPKDSNTPLEGSVKEELLKVHKEILFSNSEYEDFSSISVSEFSHKTGTGIITAKYSALMNSSGQDNLGQIILAVLSFKLLKEKNEDYIGGILLIDEIDATLHPAAQNKLIDYLVDQSKKLNLQIVFTTHSLSLLEHIIRNQDLTKGPQKDIELIYLLNKRGKLEVKENPNKIFLHNDLMEAYSGYHVSSKKIVVLTEDDVAIWFLQQILEYTFPTEVFHLNFLNMHVGWTEIIKLIKSDFSYYKNHLIFLDPDINKDNNKQQLLKAIQGTGYKLEEKSSNILLLPGNTYIEELFYNYLTTIPENHNFFYDKEIENMALFAQSIRDGGIDSQHYIKFSTPKAKHKEWFSNNKHICKIAFNYWAKDNENLVSTFANMFKSSYDIVYKRFN